MYLLLKHLHITFVALAFITFFVRGILMFTNSALLNSKLFKIAPHIINTIMLISGIAVAVHLSMSPGDHSWLMAKIIGLVVYVGLGIAAFKVSSSLARKILWVEATIVFVYILSVAITKNPMGIFLAI